MWGQPASASTSSHLSRDTPSSTSSMHVTARGHSQHSNKATASRHSGEDAHPHPPTDGAGVSATEEKHDGRRAGSSLRRKRGRTHSISQPMRITGWTGVVARVACSDQHCFIVTEAGGVFAWGPNTQVGASLQLCVGVCSCMWGFRCRFNVHHVVVGQGECGVGHANPVPTPQPVLGDSSGAPLCGVTAAGGGASYSMFMTHDRGVRWCGVHPFHAARKVGRWTPPPSSSPTRVCRGLWCRGLQRMSVCLGVMSAHHSHTRDDTTHAHHVGLQRPSHGSRCMCHRLWFGRRAPRPQPCPVESGTPSSRQVRCGFVEEWVGMDGSDARLVSLLLR